ncbi:hypothetical protein CWO92_13020 [Heyndrickxia camelliae]|uniref:Transmembrane protein n=1 Tax=Heyndrickxia camelliae TaxID=1707093 RepID=A0A2N3LJ69_9BACI|nr:hypothetical protein CWO92_13020 [Heyndrickxia camelliae]
MPGTKNGTIIVPKMVPGTTRGQFAVLFFLRRHFWCIDIFIVLTLQVTLKKRKVRKDGCISLIMQFTYFILVSAVKREERRKE